MPVTGQELRQLINDTPGKTITLSDTVTIAELDFIDLQGKIIHSTADPVFEINANNWGIANGKVNATLGVIFKCLASSCGSIRNVFALAHHPAKEVFSCTGTSSCYDTHISGGEWAKAPDMTVPIISVNVSGTFFNANSISKMRFQTNGRPTAPVIKITTSVTSTWLYGNTIADINFEVATAGAIVLGSCHGTTLQNIQIYDAHLYAPISNHMISFVREIPTALRSTLTSITSYIRPSGTMPADKYDLHIPSAEHYAGSLYINSICSSPGSSNRVKIKAPLSSMLLSRVIDADLTQG